MALSEDELRSPSRAPGFTPLWNILLDDMTDRENLKKSHLIQLEILVDLHLEYRRLSKLIEKNGYTISYESPRNGPQEKTAPEVMVRNSILTQIRSYSLLLGLSPSKSAIKVEKKEEEVW